MTFASPLFLWALLAVAIPIIIHLFNFRKYQKVYFTNVKFLRELQQESKSKSRLKEILILLCRCLAIACLVFAFAQPILFDKSKVKSVAGETAVSIYVDNSFSMENVSKQGPLLQVAIAQAKNIVRAFGNADRFQIITNDFEGKHQRFHSKDDALNVLEELRISPTQRNLDEVVKRQTDFLSSIQVPKKKIVLISDAQKSTFNFSSIIPDSSINISLVYLKANAVNNVFIDSCWFETPLQQKGFIQKLHAKIVNNGNTNIEAGSARLVLDSQQVAIASFSLAAKSYAEIKFNFESKKEGFNFGRIRIEDYPINFDDELFFTFNAEPHVSATLINGLDQKTENAFSSLFKSDSLYYFRSYSEQMIDYSSFRTSDILVLNQLKNFSSGLLSELNTFSQQGGAIVIIPAIDGNIESYRDAFADWHLPQFVELDTLPYKTEKIDFSNSFYAGVFEKVEDRINLPIVNKHYKMQITTHSDFEIILNLQNGSPLLGFSKFNNARFYLFSAPLNERCTNFTKHALFVPTFYQMSFASLQVSKLFYEVSNNEIISLKSQRGVYEQPPHIVQINSESEIIPEVRNISGSTTLFTRGQIVNPGFYHVIQDEIKLKPLAFNYSRKESDLSVYDEDELLSMIAEKGWNFVNLIDGSTAEVSSQIWQESNGKKLWKLFIFLTLLFLALELALLRLLK